MSWRWATINHHPGLGEIWEDIQGNATDYRECTIFSTPTAVASNLEPASIPPNLFQSPLPKGSSALPKSPKSDHPRALRVLPRAAESGMDISPSLQDTFRRSGWSCLFRPFRRPSGRPLGWISAKELQERGRSVDQIDGGSRRRPCRVEDVFEKLRN